jgi:hypothetical protein
MSTIIGITSGYQPQPDLSIQRDETGFTRATQTFTCRASNFSSLAFSLDFARGKAFTSLNTDSGLAGFSYLKLERATAEVAEGGVVEIAAEFAGTNVGETGEGSGGVPADETSVQFSLNVALAEVSILDSPRVRELAAYGGGSTIGTLAVFRGLIEGEFIRSPTEDPTDISGTITIISAQTQDTVAEFTQDNDKKLYSLIMIKGVRTFQAPTLEWTSETSNIAGLTATDFDNAGKIHERADVEGNPNTPTGRNWLLTGMQQQGTGGGAFTRSKTWQLSPPEGWDSDIYEEADYTNP